MFRPGSLLRSTCNNNTASASTSSSSSCSAAADTGTGSASAASKLAPPSSACSSSRALLAADSAVARDRDYSFLASSRRDFAYATAAVGRTESFSHALDRVHRRAAAAAVNPLPPTRFSVDASPLKKEKQKSPSPSPLYGHQQQHDRRRLGTGRAKSDKSKKLLSNNPYGFSTSEDDAHTDGDDVFSSDDLDERRSSKKQQQQQQGEAAFFSSSRSFSFSSDSSEFYTTKHNSKKPKPKKKKSKSSASVAPKPAPPQPAARGRPRKHYRAASSCDTCGVREGGFRPVVMSAAEEQVRRGFAVVQRSRDPYADFRASMVEMVVGRQLFGAAELERLLRSYLSLNAPRHHPVILQAFSDIWLVLHGG